MTSIGKGFQDVDATGSADAFVAYLDAASANEQLAAIKRESVAALGLTVGGAALDVGCGTGGDVALLQDAVGEHGRAAGLDVSEELVAVARQRVPGAELVAGDAAAMPFEAAAFDGVRVERVLQHVDDPAAVAVEMARVLRPGGRVTMMEPDWDTLVVAADSLDDTRRILRAWSQRVRHPDAGRRLRGLAVRAGLVGVRVTGITVVVDRLEMLLAMFDLETVASELGAQSWIDDLARRDAEGTFFAAVTSFNLVGSKPAV